MKMAIQRGNHIVGRLHGAVLFAVIAGAIILQQQMTGREYLGCVLMLIAVILAQIPNPFEKKVKA